MRYLIEVELLKKEERILSTLFMLSSIIVLFSLRSSDKFLVSFSLLFFSNLIRCVGYRILDSRLLEASLKLAPFTELIDRSERRPLKVMLFIECFGERCYAIIVFFALVLSKFITGTNAWLSPEFFDSSGA